MTRINRPCMLYLISFLAIIFLFSSSSLAESKGRFERPFEITEERHPCRHYDPLRQPFFGDLHIHTSYSMDAALAGNFLNGPRSAYRFARGRTIPLPPFDANGSSASSLRLDRPLDFAAVTDHAEYLGETRICFSPEHPGYDSPECVDMRTNFFAAFFTWTSELTDPEPTRFDFCGPDDEECLAFASFVWEETQKAAEEAYDRSSRCSFTSFLGYEWTGSDPSNAVLHRNVIFRNDAVPALPVSYIDAPRVEELWQSLERDCLAGDKRCDVLSIPHNSNVSLGKIFLPENTISSPDEAARRAFFEPLVEIIQHKGASECRSGLGTNDELCDFELLPTPFLAPLPPGAPAPAFEPLSYARNALKEGLLAAERLGVNPYQLGFVGGTDTHNSTGGATQEEDWPGHFGLMDATLPSRLSQPYASPGGLTVIWAEENSRDALYSAMERREVYATSGTRPIVRFFGGYHLPYGMCRSPRFAKLGYRLGVPMGGELEPPRSRFMTPRFAVAAWQDTGSKDQPGTPLQRIQIIKGWIEDGEARERVWDVAGNPDNGATVDPSTLEPMGRGASHLCTVWQDPEFDPDQSAFYYARVLENPTPRWNALQCRDAGVRCSDPATIAPGLEACCKPNIARTSQERAWTSPIWYMPEVARGDQP